MKWKEFFGVLTNDQRKEAAAALRSVNEETRLAQSNQQPQVVVVDAREVRRSTSRMHVENARKSAERYAEERNRRTADGAR